MDSNFAKTEIQDNKNSTIYKSIFSGWSPLPDRKLFTSKTEQNVSEETKNLYPNCDVNVWLRSCEEEIVNPLEGKITDYFVEECPEIPVFFAYFSGEIPKWLSGSLLRNGPGSLKVADMKFEHLFDSSALLHRFAINNGNVTYQCRFLQSEVYKNNHSAKRIVVTEFGTAGVFDPCQTIFQRISAIFDPNYQSDNAMISIYPFGDEMYAFTESPIIHKINKITLETDNKVDVTKYVSIINHTSHPHVLKDGTVYNLGMSITKTGLVHNIIKFPTGGNMFENAEIVASVPVRWTLHPSYMHTFGITENYFIIVEQPLSISVPSVFTNKIKNNPMVGNFRWYKDETTQIHVISRKTGKSAFKFYSEAFFFLHIINQYEISDHIVIDICCYRDPSMLDCMYIEVMKNMQHNTDYAKMFKGRPFRFILPLKFEKTDANLINIPNTKAEAILLPNGTVFVKPELLCDLGCETPRIHYENFLGKEYRYFYAISSDVDSSNPGTIIKVDTKNKSALTWCEENCYPSEPIFIPKPSSKGEDDGIILSAMVWGKKDTNRVGLIILDSATMKEVGRAVFQTPSEVPKCLHGWFCKN